MCKCVNVCPLCELDVQTASFVRNLSLNIGYCHLIASTVKFYLEIGYFPYNTVKTNFNWCPLTIQTSQLVTFYRVHTGYYTFLHEWSAKYQTDCHWIGALFNLTFFVLHTRVHQLFRWWVQYTTLMQYLTFIRFFFQLMTFIFGIEHFLKSFECWLIHFLSFF